MIALLSDVHMIALLSVVHRNLYDLNFYLLGLVSMCVNEFSFSRPFYMLMLFRPDGVGKHRALNLAVI